MKKLVSVLLIAIMLMSVLSVSAFAESAKNIVSGDYLYAEKFAKAYVYGWNTEYAYAEVYYHYVDKNDPYSEIDWILVSATNLTVSPWGIKEVVGDRVFFEYSECHPFRFKYGVYDVNSGGFWELDERVLERFTDLAQVMDELKLGYAIGDADMDKELTIMDATYVQRVAAKLTEYDVDDDITGFYDYGGDLDYISDMNRDGYRDILDATAIQLKLVGLEDDSQYNEEMVTFSSDSRFVTSNAPDMPEGSAVEFENVFHYKESYFSSSIKVGFKYPGYYYAIIKSIDQYLEIFNDVPEKFTDEFFETQWLIVSMIYVGCDEAKGLISEIGVADDTLYVQTRQYITTDYESPTEPLYICLAAVDKDEVATVTNIVRVK